MPLPPWAKNRQNSEDDRDARHYADEWEERDARSLSRGTAGRTPGSGRLRPGDLDSVVDDFKTDNKVTDKKSYSLKRDFWRERIGKGIQTGHNFRESILFRWPEAGRTQELHIVAVEGKVFEEIYHGYQDLHDFLSGAITQEELVEKQKSR